MTATPYHWVKKIEHTLEEIQQIPLWGNTPPFPWELCQKQLQEALDLPSLRLQAKETKWRGAQEILEGMGKSPFTITIELAPLSGHVHWLFSAEDLSFLIGSTLAKESLPKGFSDKGLEEGYFAYFSIKVMHAIDYLQAFPQMSLKLAPKAHLPKEGALCIDIGIELNGKILWGRLVCPSPFLHAFRRHFQSQRPPGLESILKRDVDVKLHFQVGATELPLGELRKVQVGDFVLLDQCSLDPKTRQGALTIMLYNSPIFEANLANGEVTITDYSYYQEDNHMAKEYNDEEEFDDEELDDEEFDEDEEYDEDEEFDDEDFEEDDEEEYEDDEDEEDEVEDAHEWQEEAAQGPARAPSTPLEQVIATNDLPVTLTVEVTRMRMNLEKLLELKPGNVLNLKTSIDQPLDIRMNGKKIASAELVKIGDMLGMKILHIGAV